mmetsp:Transcript_28610/g.91635  ORF Transcript_28610/g.91635 Transcript_28610/m.91635 type:complete len:228 (+) Transcript_28610:306-989(+)
MQPIRPAPIGATVSHASAAGSYRSTELRTAEAPGPDKPPTAYNFIPPVRGRGRAVLMMAKPGASRSICFPTRVSSSGSSMTTPLRNSRGSSANRTRESSAATSSSPGGGSCACSHATPARYTSSSLARSRSSSSRERTIDAGAAVHASPPATTSPKFAHAALAAASASRGSRPIRSASSQTARALEAARRDTYASAAASRSSSICRNAAPASSSASASSSATSASPV